MKPKKSQAMAPEMAPSPSNANSSTSGGGHMPSAVQASSRQVDPKPVSERAKDLAMLVFKLKRLESSGMQIPAALQSQAKEIIAEMERAESKFLGLIGKCWLSGNDCHLLSADLEIIEHFPVGSELPEGFMRVRKLVATLPPQVVGLMVYSNEFHYLYVDGSTQVAEYEND